MQLACFRQTYHNNDNHNNNNIMILARKVCCHCRKVFRVRRHFLPLAWQMVIQLQYYNTISFVGMMMINSIIPIHSIGSMIIIITMILSHSAFRMQPIFSHSPTFSCLLSLSPSLSFSISFLLLVYIYMKIGRYQ